MRIQIAPIGKRSVTTTPIIIPCALSYFAIVEALLPITVTPLPLEELVEEAVEPLDVDVELELELEINGFESEEMAAAVRSRVNTRVLESEC
jgi:hypothetical protein